MDSRIGRFQKAICIEIIADLEIPRMTESSILYPKHFSAVVV